MGKGHCLDRSRPTHISSKFWGHQAECLPCWPLASLIRFTDPYLPSDDQWCHSRPLIIAQLREFTIIAVNCGPHALQVQLEMSCDQVCWDPYGELCTLIEPGNSQVFIPTYFFPFCRLRFTNAEPGADSFLTVRFIGQT